MILKSAREKNEQQQKMVRQEGRQVDGKEGGNIGRKEGRYGGREVGRKVGMRREDWQVGR